MDNDVKQKIISYQFYSEDQTHVVIYVASAVIIILLLLLIICFVVTLLTSKLAYKSILSIEHGKLYYYNLKRSQNQFLVQKSLANKQADWQIFQPVALTQKQIPSQGSIVIVTIKLAKGYKQLIFEQQ